MRRASLLFAAVLVLTGCSVSAAGAPVATPAPSTPVPSTAATLTDIGAGLKGPAGVSATVVATGLANVAALAIDATGRLWVATAAFTDDGADALYLVTAAGATPVKVVAGLHTPLGLVWSGDTLFVASAGRVDAYRGFDGTAFADVDAALTLPDGVGEVNGLAMSSDGLLVLGVSAPCDSCMTDVAETAAVLSFLPDGSDLQVVASGIRAPVGLAYAPDTDDLFVTMNQRDDLGDATPGDWLAVVRQGQSWGFPACYGQGGAACDGVPSPIAVLDPHAAVSGVALVKGGIGAAPSGATASTGLTAYVAEWATATVLQVALTHDGTTYTGTAQPFLTGLTNPVALIASPDGSLLVGDWGTGTVYRIAAATAAAS